MEKTGKTNSALIVVDMSNDFVDPVLHAPNYCEEGYHLLPKMKKFIDLCREKGLLIIFTTHTYRRNKSDMSEAKRIDQRLHGEQHREGTPGTEIHEMIRPLEGDIVVKKHYFSGFYGTGMDSLLKANHIQTVYILGVTTDICCTATARDAQFYGYKVTMVVDLMAANKNKSYGRKDYSKRQSHQIAVNSLYSTGIAIIQSRELIEKLEEEGD